MDNKTFAAWWPTAESSARAVLVRRGARVHDVEDALQLTAERAIASDKTFESAEHLAAWCTVVAPRMATDEWRRRRREDDVRVPDHAASTDDLGDVVVALVTRDAVDHAISALPATERAAVLDASPVPVDRRDAVRISGARHRARAKLRVVFEGLAVAFGTRHLPLARRLTDWARLYPEAIAAVAVAGVAILAAPGAAVVSEPLADASTALAVHAAPSKMASGSKAPTAEVRVRLSGAAPSADGASSPAGRSSDYRDKTGLPPFSVPVPWADGSQKNIEGRPSTEEDEGRLVCGGTIVTPYSCIMSPVPKLG